VYATRLDSGKPIRRSPLISSGAFFEAHEHWESVWLAAQEPERTFPAGLIQVAAAFYHLQRGNCAETISLLRSALLRLADYPKVLAGVVVMPPRVAIRCLARSPSKQVLSFRGRQFRSFN